MSVDKITSPISELQLINKTNEIIDNLVTVDATLSTTSENPVQNKVITDAIEEKATVTFIDWTV